tara:strand:- start:5435 stop:5665 length:231 start_codon:yes stop_codon:yes gene_type:complete
MPVKYKKDEIQVKRNADGSQTKTIKRYYMQNETTEFLIDLLNEEKTKPKLKHKIRNFLSHARGIKLVRKDKDGVSQ